METNKDKDIKNRLDNLKNLLNQPKVEEPKQYKKRSKERGKAINPLADKLEIPDVDENFKNITFTIPSDNVFTNNQIKFLQLYGPMYYNITAVCNSIGINRQTFYQWCKETPGFKQSIEDLEQGMTDKAIEVINKTMESLDAKSAMFVLKTLGKKRGFGETLDITSNGQTIQIPIINILQPKDEETQ